MRRGKSVEGKTGLYKVDSSTYVIRWTDSFGKRPLKTLKDTTERKAWKELCRRQTEADQFADDPEKAMTASMRTIIEFYLQENQGKRNIENHSKRIIKKFGGLQLANLRKRPFIVSTWFKSELADQIIDETDKEPSQKTIWNHHTTWNAAINLWIKSRQLQITSPLRLIRVPKGDKVRDFMLMPGHYELLLDKAKVGALIGKYPEDLWQWVLFGRRTGHRKGEIQLWNWGKTDLNPQEGLPYTQRRILKQKEEIWKKCPLEPEVVNVLRARGPLQVGQILKRFPEEHWQALKKECGLEEVWYHDFRKAYIHEKLEKGWPEVVIMQFTGHKTKSVFQRYSQLTSREMDGWIKRTA